jgi:hypothetical protein
MSFDNLFFAKDFGVSARQPDHPKPGVCHGWAVFVIRKKIYFFTQKKKQNDRTQDGLLNVRALTYYESRMGGGVLVTSRLARVATVVTGFVFGSFCFELRCG